MEIEDLRQRILEVDSDFGRRCLDYFACLNLKSVKADSTSSPPMGIEGYLDLDEEIKSQGIFEMIRYGIAISPILGTELSKNPNRILFNIDVKSSRDGLRGIFGSLRRDSYEIHRSNLGSCRADNRYGLQIHQIFLNEMTKAHIALFRDPA